MALSKEQLDAIEELGTAYEGRFSLNAGYNLADRDYYKRSITDWIRTHANNPSVVTRRAAIAQMRSWLDYIPAQRISGPRKIELMETIFGMSVQPCYGCRNYSASDRMITENTHLYCRTCRPSEASSCEPNGAIDFEFPALPLKDHIVKADAQFTLDMPGGEISQTGLSTIYQTLHDRTGGINVHELLDGELAQHPMWQSKEGNFTKRLSKLLYETRHVKLDEKLLAEIGNIAKRYTAESRPWKLEFTRRLNGRTAADFAHSTSCWWSSYWQSRCRFKAAGGIALRSFNPETKNPTQPTGRVWIVPVQPALSGDRWRSHPELPAPGYVLFNAYGPELFPFARVVAHLTGKSYRGIDFTRNGMYVNNNRGVLVASQEALSKSNYIELSDRRQCDCGDNGDQ